MKSLCAAVALTVIAAGFYIATPFVTAWNIREAVRTGNSEYLTTAIEWPSVRETLKPSIARMALDLPNPDQTPAEAQSLWQRAKAYWGQGAVNNLVDSYVTPEGLPQLFSLHKAYRNYVSGNDETNALPVLERAQRAWSRVQRAKFTGLATFEIDMADKNDPARVYLGKMELTSAGWKLTELRVRFPNLTHGATQNIANVRGTL